ncbi:type IV pilin protein [Candidatus Avelusimicrobium stercoris]|uniref:type IV pilin protein n=1 Tax=Candidatus Avelusimicrobium stercoris TaxID=1947924 RepID=UPI003D0B6BEB
MKKNLFNGGFTLVEILVVIMIVALLVTMAMPMYEKTVEKSRMTESRTMLKKILESKLRTLDNMDQTNYSSGLFGFENLDVSVPCINTSTGAKLSRCSGNVVSTKDFTYNLLPSGSIPGGSTANIANAVCAVRRTGDYAGVNFLFLGELETDPSKEKFFCNNGGVTDGCNVYGLDSTGSAWCR